MFILKIEDKVTFKINGNVLENGLKKPFSFKLTGPRLNAEEMQQLSKDNDQTIEDFLMKKVEDWSDVVDSEGAPIPFNKTSFHDLLNHLGVAAIIFEQYIEASGAKSKN